MPHHSRRLAAVSLLLQFVVASALALVVASSRAPPPAVYTSVSGDAVDVYSFPALDDRAGHGRLVVTTTSSILSPDTFLFDAQLFPEFNRTEGFVLLSQPVRLWGGAATAESASDAVSTRIVPREASFNTSFTLLHDTAAPVSFVVLLDSFPPLAASQARGGGTINGSSSMFPVLNASDSLASVQVGAVGSYGPESPDVGLNVTVTPNGTAASSGMTIWIQYNAVAHRICVHVAAAGEPRPVDNAALLDAPLNLAGRRTTQSAFVGFYASTVRVVIRGVTDWELTVDRFPGTDDGDEQNGSVSISSRVLILLVVLGAVGAMIGVASVVVCYSLSRRRQELKMEHIMKQVYPQPTGTRREGGFGT